VPIVGTGIRGLAPPFLSGKDLASKIHLDNPDFGGPRQAQVASFTTPKFYAQHGLHRHVLRPRNILSRNLIIVA
jgi:hypothetical protein